MESQGLSWITIPTLGLSSSSSPHSPPPLLQVAIRRRPSLFVINLLVPSGFLVAIDAFSFYLPAEYENRAPFKMTLLLGYNVFLLMMNDMLPATGTPLISTTLSWFLEQYRQEGTETQTSKTGNCST